MKKYFVMAVLVVLVATPAMALSVVGSKHDMVFWDFASAPPGGSTEVCIFCHTPHGAQAGASPVPLWNNTADGTKDVTVVYGNPNGTTNFAANLTDVNATDARLCLACHDSGVGMPINQPNAGDMVVGGTAMSANALLSRSLANDHPIGMDLGATPEVNPDDGLYSGIRALAVIIGPTGFNGNPFYGVDNTMWCSSCHDVHNNINIPFLRLNNAGSAMCKACHIK